MDAETAKSLDALKGLFGDRVSLQIFQKLQEYVTNFEMVSVYRDRRWVTINAVIDSISWYIETYNPTKQEDDPFVNAGKLAYNKIIRKYYIYLIFTVLRDEAIKASNDLLDIIANCLAKKENLTIMSASIDQFIKAFVTKYRIQISPVVLHDAEQAHQKAETDARARGPQSYENGPTATLVELQPRLGGLAPSSDPDPLQHTFGNVDNPLLRECILNIEKETPGVILNLNDPATRIAIFNRLNANAIGPPFTKQEVMDEIDLLLTDRKSLPPHVIFPPDKFTPIETEARDEAGKLGWSHAMGTFKSPYFFPDKPGGAAAAGRGGNKRIKSKKNSKRRYKKSKKRSNRRRRRYSYKK
jgi:hypothetical protein